MAKTIKNGGVSTEYLDQIRKKLTEMGLPKNLQEDAIREQYGTLGAAMRESQPIEKVAKMLYAIKNSSFKTGCMKAENAISAKLKNAGIKIGNEQPITEEQRSLCLEQLADDLFMAKREKNSAEVIKIEKKIEEIKKIPIRK
jgi:hypothetical protein